MYSSSLLQRTKFHHNYWITFHWNITI